MFSSCGRQRKDELKSSFGKYLFQKNCLHEEIFQINLQNEWDWDGPRERSSFGEIRILMDSLWSISCWLGIEIGEVKDL